MRRMLLLGTAFLLAAGVAGASNTQSYVDPAGDGSPDITNAQLSNDDNGGFELRITLADRPDLLDGENLGVTLNTDNNTSTGCIDPEIGADYEFSVGGHTEPTADHFVLFRCLPINPKRACPPADPRYCPDIYTPQRTFGGTYDRATRTAIFHFRCAEIGRPASIGMFVTTGTGGIGTLADGAGLWNYSVLPACPPDRSKPRLRALRSSGRRGRLARLNFRVADDSGYTKESYRVYFKNKLYKKTKSVDYASADPTKTYYATWPVPRRVRRPVRFCARARDEAGNRSKWSCAAVTIR
jgi:hypothetical protein